MHNDNITSESPGCNAVLLRVLLAVLRMNTFSLHLPTCDAMLRLDFIALTKGPFTYICPTVGYLVGP